MRFTTRLVATVAITALVSGFSSVAPAVAGSGDNPCWDYRPAERGFARKMNGARSNSGLGKIRLDPELSKAARLHTREMVRSNTLYHTPSDKLRNRVTRWVILGENVGVGGTVDSLHEAFMNSPAHRDNVLHATYRHVGIGTRKADGRMWVTIIFEGVTDPGTPLQMPRC